MPEIQYRVINARSPAVGGGQAEALWGYENFFPFYSVFVDLKRKISPVLEPHAIQC